jgi:hypothetical protein
MLTNFRGKGMAAEDGSRLGALSVGHCDRCAVRSSGSDLVFLPWRDAGWTVRVVGRCYDVLHDGAWHFRHFTAAGVTERQPKD